MAARLPVTTLERSNGTERAAPHGQPPERRVVARWADPLFAVLTHGAAWLTLALLVGIIVSLVFGAAPAIQKFGLGFLWSKDWDPVQE
jgi:phosphate transport system permease protein